MSKKLLLVAMAIVATFSCFAQKKSGIISFNINGKDHMAGMGSSDQSSPELYFIGDNSTQLSDTAFTSDEIVRYTEQALKEFLGYELVPADLKRPASAVAQMDGHMMVMQTITEKNAFNKLGYDEAITVNVRVYSNGKSGSTYKPAIEISLKIIDKNGKTTFKKTEKLKPDERVDALLVERDDDNTSLLDIVKSVKNNKKEKAGSIASEGVQAIKLLDWYKQCFGNLLIENKK